MIKRKRKSHIKIKAKVSRGSGKVIEVEDRKSRGTKVKEDRKSRGTKVSRNRRRGTGARGDKKDKKENSILLGLRRENRRCLSLGNSRAKKSYSDSLHVLSIFFYKRVGLEIIKKFTGSIGL